MENKEFERLETLLKSKSYEALTQEEQDWVETEIGGERAFKHLAQFMIELSAEPIQKPSPKTKKELVNAFRSKNQTTWSRVLSYRMPVIASAFVWILIAIGFWFTIPKKEVIVEKQIPFETVKLDTLYVELPQDTVIIEKTIRIEVPVYLPAPEKEPEIIVVKGDAMSEQKDLQRLLVSGEEI